MVLANPHALFFGLLAIPVVLFYLAKPPARRHVTATSFLWDEVIPGRGGPSVWWRWRHRLSLVLQLAILGLLVLALADPQWRPPRRSVLVIDTSASMNATDVQPTRLDQARHWASQWLAALGEHDEAAVVLAGEPLRVPCGMTPRRQRLEQAVNNVPMGKGPTRIHEAVALARQLAGTGPNAEVIVLTDGCFPGADQLARTEGVRIVLLAGAGDNLGMAALRVRRSAVDPRTCQVLVEVASFTRKPTACRLEFRWKNTLVDAVPIRFAGPGRWQRVFQMESAEAGRLEARIDRADDYAGDNQASVWVPPCGTCRVVLPAAASRYLRDALAANPRVELEVSDARTAKTSRGSVYAYEGRTPSKLPDGPVLVVDPQNACDLWSLGDGIAEPIVAGQAAGSAILAGVRLEGVRLPQARRLILTEAARPVAAPLLWTAQRAALAFAIDRPGGRVVVLSGALETSDLPKRAAWPVMLAGAVEWLSAPLVQPDRPPQPSQLSDNQADESDLCTQVGTVPKATQEAAVRGPAGPPVWISLAAAALAAMVAEWCLYHRRWTC